MDEFQQSKTFTNVQNAYETSLQISTLYEIFSNTATDEVLIQIAYLYDTVSRNERVIAERLRTILLGGNQTDTLQNLLESQTKALEINATYRNYAAVAKEEGFEDIAALFSGIANIVLNHNLAFQTLSDDIQNNELFCKDREALWICNACGNILSRKCAPAICPVCGYPQGYYQFLRF